MKNKANICSRKDCNNKRDNFKYSYCSSCRKAYFKKYREEQKLSKKRELLKKCNNLQSELEKNKSTKKIIKAYPVFSPKMKKEEFLKHYYDTARNVKSRKILGVKDIKIKR